MLLTTGAMFRIMPCTRGWWRGVPDRRTELEVFKRLRKEGRLKPSEGEQTFITNKGVGGVLRRREREEVAQSWSMEKRRNRLLLPGLEDPILACN